MPARKKEPYEKDSLGAKAKWEFPCPTCDNSTDVVKITVSQERVTRVRECLYCGRIFPTTEVPFKGSYPRTF